VLVVLRKVHRPLHILEARYPGGQDSDLHERHRAGLPHKAVLESLCPKEFRVESRAAQEPIQESHPLLPHWPVQHYDCSISWVLYATPV
jgi:hypothetical protein